MPVKGFNFVKMFGSFFQDLHLAKRYYDRAAELSVDAHTPVALALMGVGLIYAWQQFSAFFNNATVRGIFFS